MVTGLNNVRRFVGVHMPRSLCSEIMDKDILYDYKVELTGVGSRSQINADDNTVIQLHFCIAYFSFAQAGRRGTCLRPLCILAFALL